MGMSGLGFRGGNLVLIAPVSGHLVPVPYHCYSIKLWRPGDMLAGFDLHSHLFSPVKETKPCSTLSPTVKKLEGHIALPCLSVCVYVRLLYFFETFELCMLCF